MDTRKAVRFCDIVNSLRKEALIFEESIQGFRVVASKGRFTRRTSAHSGRNGLARQGRL
jgi:hypothetical protein